MKHYGLVELNEFEKAVLKSALIEWDNDCKLSGHDISCTMKILERLSALGISYTYNKKTGIK